MTLIPANIAKRKSEEVLVAITNKQLESISIKIDEAIRAGRRSIEVNNLSQNSRTKLEENGYKVSTSSDPRDYSGYTISW